MHSNAFLRFLAPLLLAAAMVGCGDDGGSTKQPVKTKDAGRDAGKKDAGKTTSDQSSSKADDDDDDDDDTSDDDSSDDDSSDDTSNDEEDAGTEGCTSNDDCPPGDGDDAGIGCCDTQTGMCFVHDGTACPAVLRPTGSRQSYN